MLSNNYRGGLTLVRGPSGYGKSQYALGYSRDDVCAHVEADMYMYNDKGEYQFEFNKLAEAHDWCYKTTEVYLRANFHVVVSNTFTRVWEMQRYYDLAQRLGVGFHVERMATKFQNDKGVPDEVVQRQEERMEDWPGEYFVVRKLHHRPGIDGDDDYSYWVQQSLPPDQYLKYKEEYNG